MNDENLSSEKIYFNIHFISRKYIHFKWIFSQTEHGYVIHFLFKTQNIPGTPEALLCLCSVTASLTLPSCC